MTRETINRSRPWHRLHASTWLVTLVVMVGLVLIIAPGDKPAAPKSAMSTEFIALPSRFEHGWPLVYLDSWPPDSSWTDGYNPTVPAWMRASGWNWAMSGDNSRFLPWNLLIDLAAAGVVLACAAGSFEYWRRCRRRLWQIHLTDLAGMALLVALVFGWWKWHQVRWRAEQQALQQLEGIFSEEELSRSQAARNVSEDPFRLPFYEVQNYIGPLWLARLIGYGHLPQEFETITNVHVIAWPDDSFRKQAPAFSDLPNLRGLDISWANDADLLALPKLGQLEELFLYSRRDAPLSDAALPAVGRMTNLRRLGLRGAHVSDAGLVHLHTLTRLTWLNLRETGVTRQGVAELQRRLPDCEIESDDATVGDDASSKSQQPA